MVVDSIGLLAQLYQCCSVAFVGGALHHRVHNVLEPTCYGLPIAFGPKYQTSKEAIELVNENLATVVSNNSELDVWWRKMDDKTQRKELECRLKSHIQNLGGASNRIIEDLGVLDREQKTDS